MAMTYLTRLKPEAKGIYSADTAYEANSLVTSTDGARAYLCVKDAPAGTPLTNTEYYVIHTDMSAARESALDAADVALAARNEMLEIARGLTDAVEASGNPVQKQLAGAIPFDSVETVLEPVQAGWTGAKLTRCGENLLPAAAAHTQSKNGITFTSNGDGTYTIEGTSTGSTAITFEAESVATIPAGAYIHLCNTGVTNSNVAFVPHFTDGSTMSIAFSLGNRIHQIGDTYTGRTIQKIGIYVNGAQTVDITFKPMMCVDGTAKVFESYDGNVYTADFGQTIYGGTLNWTTGVLTVTGDNETVDSDTIQLTPQEIKQLNGTNTLYGDGVIWIQGRERPGQNDA